MKIPFDLRRHRQWLTLPAVAAAFAAATVTANAADHAGRLVARPAVANGGTTQSETLSYTGSEQNFQVPDGVTALEISAAGGAGGESSGPVASAPAGAAGSAWADLPVTPGEILNVYVGGAGQTPATNALPGGAGGSASGAAAAGGAGGSISHGESGGGGGGATLVTTLDGLGGVLVAAGGGGGAGGGYYINYSGGAGGNGGNPPQDGSPSQRGYSGGAGGGAGAPQGSDGQSGPMGFTADGSGGGGGGGGYPSGGAGGTAGNGAGQPAGGGGGGDSYVTPSATASSFSTTDSTNGSVTITWTQPIAPTVTMTTSTTLASAGSPVTLTANVMTPLGDPTPTGTVLFIDQGTAATIGSVQLSPSNPGVAALRTSSLPDGTGGYYAAYLGDGNYQGESSDEAYVTVYDRTVAVPAGLKFGAVTSGGEKTMSVNVANTGKDPVTFSSESVNDEPFAIASSTCNGATLSAGQSCSITVAFAPATAGSYTGKLTIDDNATTAKGSQKVALSGTGQ